VPAPDPPVAHPGGASHERRPDPLHRVRTSQ